jgi:dihydropyrimidine dehydrogenase (NAD+) subunit PreT
MADIPATRSETAFGDFKPAYSDAEARTEANRCLYCSDAPCIKKCPTAINIPEFIRKIATENLWGSARTILDSNILGMSCARVCPVEVLCVGDCVYNEMGAAPIQIGKLQRYATDIAFAADWRYFKAGPDTGKSVALVGGGPASLAAAHELRRQGHACTIYEKRDVLGGLNTTGVAPYKMRADRSNDEVDYILGIGGIELKMGLEIGKDITFGELEKRHDAVFIGFGLGPDGWLDIPGNDRSGVRGAVDFIEAFKLGQEDLSGVSQALVIGGGNTAVDVVRELIGLGVDKVTMVYRRTDARMSGYAHEWKVAKAEGALAEWRTVPDAFEGADGVLTGLRVHSVDDGMNAVDGSERVLPAQLALLAVGQGKLGDLLANVDGVELSWGKVVTDDDGATGRAGWYAGGDCRNGGKEVVNAAAEGKAAAIALDAWLQGGNSLRGGK